MATFDLEVDPDTADGETVALRFKTLAAPRVVTRVRNAIGGREGWYSVVGVDEGGVRVPAHAVDVEDSSEGTATLVHGGRHGLELVSEDDGATTREPYLVLAPSAIG